MTGDRKDDVILQHYDRLLIQHGDTAQGAHWPNEEDRQKRNAVMLGLIPENQEHAVLCDLGCGSGELLSYIQNRGLDHLDYVGADRSAMALSFARYKFPEARFIEIDVNDTDAAIDALACDWLVCNGVFTVKWTLSAAEMWDFLSATLHRVWPVVRSGLAFNVMSKAVDWERDDLFHASMDDMAKLLHQLAGRRVVFRADYGLYEYTSYVYK